MSDENTQPEVEETQEPFEVLEPEDTMLSDQVDAYIAERIKAQAEEGEEEEEEESDCPDGDCDEEDDEYDEDLEALGERAANVGLDAEDIERIGSVEALERMVLILEARNEAESKEPAEEPEDTKTDFADVPDELRPALEQITKAYEERIEALESQLGQYNEYVDGQAEKAAKSEFDGFVGELGSDYESLFGTGSTDNLRDGSTELSNRTLLLEEMNAMAAGYEAMGREVPDEKTLFNKALSSVFSEEVMSIKQNSRESQIAERRSKFVGRPSQRHGKQKSPEAAAIASVRQYMEEAGIGLGAQE